MKIDTSELTGAALDWAVNQIEECCDDPYAPLFSTNWAQGGPIIEREGIALHRGQDGVWWARIPPENFNPQILASAPTPLIAAMRCYVASNLGDEVDIPDELLEI